MKQFIKKLKSSNISGLFSNQIVQLGGIVVLVFVFPLIRKFWEKKKYDFSKMDVNQQQSFKSAQLIASSFGVASSWWSVDSWTEDETAVIEELKEYSYLRSQIEDEYYKLTTRSLEKDLIKFLSPSDLKEI